MKRQLISSVLILLLCSVSGFSTADDLAGFYLGGAATGYFLDKSRFVDGKDDDAATLGLNLGYRYDNPFAVEVGVAAGNELDAFKLDGFYYFTRSESGWSPYFVLGYTQFKFDDDSVLADSDDSTGQFDAGFGFSRILQDSQWEFRGDGRFLEKVDSGKGATDLALTLAVNYYFDKPEKQQPVAEAAPVAKPAPAPKPQTRSITVKLNVEFEFNKATVRAIYGDELAAVASAMKAHEDIMLVLEGHTDAIGSEEYNQDLSQRRVEAVKARLVEDLGIPANRITAVGYGESRPIADNNTDEGRAKNRRVVGELTFTEVVPE